MAGLAAMVAGLVLRLYHMAGNSLWYDEVHSIAAADHSWQGVLSSVRSSGNIPPLYAYALKIWMFIGTADWWLRLGNVLLGAGVVILTWVLGRRMVDSAVALLATLLCALSVYEIYYSQYVRMYMMLAMLTLVSVYCMLRAVETNRRLWWALWAVSAAACMYSFYYAAFLMAGEGLWLVILAARRRELRLPTVVWGAVAIALFLPWTPTMIAQTAKVGLRAWIHHPTSRAFFDLYNQFTFDAIQGLHVPGAQLTYDIRNLLLVPFVLGLVLPGQDKERLLLALILVCGGLAPIILSIVSQPVYDPRYEVFVAAPFYLVVARGVVQGLLWVERHLRLPGRVVSGAFAVVALLIIVGSIQPLRRLYGDVQFAQADLRGAVEMIMRDHQAGDVVIHNAAFGHLPALWYAHQEGRPGPCVADRAWDAPEPEEWLRGVALMQVFVNPPTAAAPTVPLPRGGGACLPHGPQRLWLLSLTNFRAHEKPWHVDAWFHPPAAQWRQTREVTSHLGVLVRLYVRR